MIKSRHRAGDDPKPATSYLIGATPAPGLHVMSWNIRRRVRHAIPREVDRWEVRAPRLRMLLRAEQPALLGVQEALPVQAHFVRESLGASYRSVGHGRDVRGDGEGCQVFYDADRLELLDWEQSALSDQPTQPGSTSWGNIIPRIMVSATFRDHATGHRFLAINTHFDHLSRRSRLRSAQTIARLASTSALPTVITGDLNAEKESPPLSELLSGHKLVDVHDAALSLASEPWGTFANYRPPNLKHRRLDWILVSPEVEVVQAGINAQSYDGGWASDHLPVQAVLLLPGNGDGT